MFNEKEIQDKLNSFAMEALEEMYQDGIDKSFNHVEEIKIYETEGLRRNLKAQISSIKSLMSAARERGDESAVKEYESHLENLRSKRNSVKEDTLYTFENGEIVEIQEEQLDEAKTDDEAEKMVRMKLPSHGKIEKVKKYKEGGTTYHVFKHTHDDGVDTHVASKWKTKHNNGWVVNKTHTQPLQEELKVGQTVRISNNHPNKEWRNKTATIHKVVVPNEHYQVDISGSVGKKFEVVSKHHIQESLDEELKVGDKVIVRPPSYPHMKWEGKIVKKSKHGKDFHRVEYEYDGMGGGKAKHTDTFHKKHLTKIDEEVVKSETTKDGITIDHHHNGIKHVSTISDVDGEYYSHKYDGHTKSEMLNHFRNHVLPKGVKEAEKTLWDEKKDKWLEKFTKDQKEKKKDKEVNEAGKVYDPLTKKNVKTKPMKQKMGGGWRKTDPHTGVVIDSSDKNEIGKKVNEAREQTHYHSVWVKHNDTWKHDFDADDKFDANEQKNYLKNNGEKVKVIRVHKDEADWRNPEHVAKAHARLNEEEQLDEAARHFVYKHWPDLMEFRQVGKKGGYASKEEAQKHADKFNANKDKHEIEHHYTVKSIGVVKEDEEQLDEESDLKVDMIDHIRDKMMKRNTDHVPELHTSYKEGDVHHRVYTVQHNGVKEKWLVKGKKENGKNVVTSQRMNEQQLDEISKKTLGSYIKKAAAEVSRHSYDTAKEMTLGLTNHSKYDRSKSKEHLDKADLHADKSGKRQKGIHKAIDKLTKESTKLDEEVSFDDYKKKVKALGYTMSTKNYSDFSGVSKYKHKEHGEFNASSSIHTKDSLEKHKELNALRQEHKGKVFDGMRRVIV